ncbi:hypothetical protein O181_005205 [Austropuccinia psidii MF-1]|uniref:Beta-xylanase n=1 Tax=Austropuccinia psidii MF-1 TaxID=1389203 RepID=A0A9Q3GFL5_9BASI|nr:hypothetical protein [Austropuccinia psidii MF-1]
MYNGVAVSAQLLSQNEKYREVVKKYFQVLTPENEMKWDVIQKQQGVYDFKAADLIIAFANENSRSYRIHTIVWHRQVSQWLNALSADELQKATRDHIDKLISRYDKAVAIDVCNEIVDDNAQIRQNLWRQKLGEDDYFVEIYQAARLLAQKYNKNLKLFLNDYSIEGINQKSNKVLQLATKLKQKGLLDAVGMQAHLEVGKVPKDMKKNMERFIAAGLEVAITELDIRMQVPGGKNATTQQKADFQEVFAICKSLPKCLGITVWGVNEAQSWIPHEFPGWGNGLLFQDDFSPKDFATALLSSNQQPQRSKISRYS